MSDQGLSAPENTPAVAGPEGPAPSSTDEAVDWQKRYTDLQSEYTQTSQERAELRHQRELYDLLVSTDDEDTRRRVAEQLGYQLDQEEPEPEFDENPFAAYDKRIGQLESALTVREEREREDAYASEVRRVCDEQLETLGIDKEDQDWVLAYAINALPVNDQGLPDIRQAHAVFAAREDARQRQWATTKRRAPRISPNGQPATEVPNLDNRNERVEWMTRRLEEGPIS
jgi:hypothetical protein